MGLKKAKSRKAFQALRHFLEARAIIALRWLMLIDRSKILEYFYLFIAAE